jgi:hypothetical protein
MPDVGSMPQKLGATFYGRAGTIPSSSADYGGIHLEGGIRVFRVKTLSDRTVLFGQYDLTALLVRNTSAGNLTPGRGVTWAAGFYKRRVDGYSRTTAVAVAGFVDPYLPSVGVRAGDLFWLCVKGPALIKTDLAGGANNLLPEGTVLVALTGATSGATTAGRIAPQDLTGATAVLGAQLQNKVGTAMSARTTANTNVDILVDLSIAGF